MYRFKMHRFKMYCSSLYRSALSQFRLYRLIMSRLQMYTLLIPIVVLIGVVAIMQPASASAVLSIDAPDEVELGRPFSITMVIKGVNDLAGFDTALFYDSSALEFGGFNITADGIRGTGRDIDMLMAPNLPYGSSVGFFSCPTASCVERTTPRIEEGGTGDFPLVSVTLLANKVGQIEIKLGATHLVDVTGSALQARIETHTLLIEVVGDESENSQRPIFKAPNPAWGSAARRVSVMNALSVEQLDLTGDGRITYADAAEVSVAWQLVRIANAPCGDVDSVLDVNGDGCIDVADIQLVTGSYDLAGEMARNARKHGQQRLTPSNAIENTTMGVVTDTINNEVMAEGSVALETTSTPRQQEDSQTYLPLITTPPPSSTFYIDCERGSDENDGRSKEQAWRSLERGNAAELKPGDAMLLRRGCTWMGTLRAAWHGTDDAPIKLGAYGEGDLPLIHNSAADIQNLFHASVEVTGSYQIIEHLATTTIDPPTDPNCDNQPIGFYVGFNFTNPDALDNHASHNILRHVQSSGHTLGVHLNSDANFNSVLNSEFTENHIMHILTPVSIAEWDDLGAWGILLKGDNNEIANNYFFNNNGSCAYDGVPHGNTIEIYEARNNIIHNNVAIGDRVFSELGGSEGRRADGNRFIYNLVVSAVPEARFIVVRGSGNQFGPTYRTEVYHNTVYYTGEGSEAIVCGAGCSDEILTAENNIFWAEEKVVFADAPFIEGHNIYWSSSGEPLLQLSGFTIAESSMLANPRFVNAEAGDFRLLPDSPAIDMGSNFTWSRDLANVEIPQGEGYDIGAYEFQGE